GIIDTEATREPKEETKSNKQEEKKTEIIRNKGRKKVKPESRLLKKEERTARRKDT
ncbi:7319_t:CDS:1, partial [Gigaspora margarita]